MFFVQSNIGALIALPDMDKPLDDTGKELMYQQTLFGFTIFQISTISREISTNSK